MKKVITCLFFFGILSFCSLSAQTYFSKTYNFSTNTEIGTSVVMRESGRFTILGIYFDFEMIPNSPTQSLFLMKMDRFGNEIWLQKYVDNAGELYPGSNSLMVTGDGGYAFGGGYSQRVPEDLPPKYLIGKFDRNGNKEWFKTYGREGWDTGLQAKRLYDGGYLMVGASKSFSNDDNYDAYIVRTDVEGEVVWEKNFGGVGWDQINSIDILPNRTLILGGQREDYGLGGWDSYLCKMDMDGNILWERTYGTELSDCSVGVSVLKDGNYLIKSCDGAVLHGQPSSQKYVAKIDTLGNIIWRWNMGEVGSSKGIAKIQEFSDGSLGFVGLQIDKITDTHHGWMGRLSENGELMWEKDYYTVKSRHQNFYDMVINWDDDMIAVGQAYNEENPSNGEGLNLWVVKVNCMGEFESLGEEGCDMIVGIENELLLQQNSLHIFPNPSQDQVQFAWNTPATQLSVYNITGQLMEQIPLDLGQKALQLEVVDWKGGVYLVVLEGVEGAILGREKLIIGN